MFAGSFTPVSISSLINTVSSHNRTLLSCQTDQAVIYVKGKEGGRQDRQDVISVGYVDDVKEKAFVSAHYILYFLLGAVPLIQGRREEWAQTFLHRLFEESNFVFEAHAQHRRHKGTVNAVNIDTAKQGVFWVSMLRGGKRDQEVGRTDTFRRAEHRGCQCLSLNPACARRGIHQPQAHRRAGCTKSSLS